VRNVCGLADGQCQYWCSGHRWVDIICEFPRERDREYLLLNRVRVPDVSAMFDATARMKD
jgi:hypothetical protein